MSAHTPGPWICHLGQPDDMPPSTCRCCSILAEPYQGAVGQVFVDNGKTIADGGNDCPPEAEARANARLIAAAPDLLAALESLLIFIPIPSGRLGEADVKYPAIAAARAAIKKAKGEG